MTIAEQDSLEGLIAEYRRSLDYQGEFCATDEQWDEVIEAKDEALCALYPHVPEIIDTLSQMRAALERIWRELPEANGRTPHEAAISSICAETLGATTKIEKE